MKIDESQLWSKFEIDNLRFAKDLFNVEDDTQQSRSVESLIKSIGIEKRRVCTGDVTSLDLGVRAAKELFRAGEFKADDFGGIVFVTETPDDLCPNNSSYVQHLLGFPENTAVLDINHACPDILWFVVSGLMASNIQKKVLLLVQRLIRILISKHDRATAPLSDAWNSNYSFSK